MNKVKILLQSEIDTSNYPVYRLTQVKIETCAWTYPGHFFREWHPMVVTHAVVSESETAAWTFHRIPASNFLQSVDKFVHSRWRRQRHLWQPCSA